MTQMYHLAETSGNNSVRRCRLDFASLIMFGLAAAVGCDDGKVNIKGQIQINGQPADGGELLLSPMVKGPRAFSYVDGDGQFVLQSDGQIGATPGVYKVLYRREVDEAEREKLPARLRSKITSSAITISYSSPSEFELKVTEEGADDLVIDIDQSTWITRLTD